MVHFHSSEVTKFTLLLFSLHLRSGKTRKHVFNNIRSAHVSPMFPRSATGKHCFQRHQEAKFVSAPRQKHFVFPRGKEMFLDVSPFCHDRQDLLSSNQRSLVPMISRQTENNMVASAETAGGETSKKKKN